MASRTMAKSKTPNSRICPRWLLQLGAELTLHQQVADAARHYTPSIG
jgi:hypothetical protein